VHAFLEGEIRTERLQNNMFSGFPVLERFAVEARTLAPGTQGGEPNGPALSFSLGICPEKAIPPS